MMPEGLLDFLTNKEVIDLVGFLQKDNGIDLE